MLVICGVRSGGGITTGFRLNVTVVVFATLFTVAVIVAVPAVDDVSVAVATPFVVVRIIVCAFASVKVPRLVVNSTAVPFGTGWPFCVTVAVMIDDESTCGCALESLSAIV